MADDETPCTVLPVLPVKRPRSIRTSKDGDFPRKRRKVILYSDIRSFCTSSFNNLHVESHDALEFLTEITRNPMITLSAINQIQSEINGKRDTLRQQMDQFQSIGIPVSDLQPTLNTISELMILSTKMKELIDSFHHQNVDQSHSTDFSASDSEDSSSDFELSRCSDTAEPPPPTLCRKRKRRSKRRKKVLEIVQTAPLNSRYFETPNIDGIEWQCPMTICSFINRSPRGSGDQIRCSKCYLWTFKSLHPEIFPNDEIKIDRKRNGVVIDHIEDGVSPHDLAKRLGIELSATRPSPPKVTLTLNDIASFQIVLILGESGCGKSTILKSLHSQHPDLCVFLDPMDLEWNDDKAVISEFDEEWSSEDRINLMSSIGLNSIPSWLKPFHILSNGERYRASFARLLSTGMKRQNQWILIDEFTSVLDRANGRCIASSISKYIRRNRGNEIAKFVMASSKHDIIPYLQPDAVVSLAPSRPHQIIVNPNNLNDRSSCIPDTKVVLDLVEWNQLKNHRVPIFDHFEFDDQSLRKKGSVSISGRARRLQCQIEMDRHSASASSVFDIMQNNGDDDGDKKKKSLMFDGVTMTDIPCLERHDIGSGDFSIGLIYGPSGSGKTSTGERLFGRIANFPWNNTKAICYGFSSIDDLEEKFTACSLSPRLGLSKYHQLSQGERDRVDIAVKLGSNNVLIDEFTSNLDRETAERVALGLREYVDRHQLKNVVLLSCHCDVVTSLRPEWVFHVENKKVIHYETTNPEQPINGNDSTDSAMDIMTNRGYIDSDSIWLRPKIRIQLKPSNYKAFEAKFAKYHYMDHSISVSAVCFTAWASFGFMEDSESEDAAPTPTRQELVGFISILPNPFRSKMSEDEKNHWREHRTVILPPYQGMGFGSRICDAVALYLSQRKVGDALNGQRLHSKTAHPRYGRSKDDSPLWIPMKSNHQITVRKPWHHIGDSEEERRRTYKEKKTMNVKRFYSHIFKLRYQRTAEDEEYLKQRVIVENALKMNVNRS